MPICMECNYKFKFAESRKSELIKENNHMQDIKNEEYVICPRCEQEVYKEVITCPFCNFGIMRLKRIRKF